MSARNEIWSSPDDSVSLYEDLLEGTVSLEIKAGPTVTLLPLPPKLVAAILASQACRAYAETGSTGC